MLEVQDLDKNWIEVKQVTLINSKVVKEVGLFKSSRNTNMLIIIQDNLLNSDHYLLTRKEWELQGCE